jgi:hypothetical protein
LAHISIGEHTQAEPFNGAARGRRLSLGIAADWLLTGWRRLWRLSSTNGMFRDPREARRYGVAIREVKLQGHRQAPPTRIF